MQELRWILLVVGAVAVLGVYLWSRRNSAARDEPAEPKRREPVLDETPAPWEPTQPPRPSGSRRPEAREIAPEPAGEAASATESLIVVLRVRARTEQGFPGSALAEAFANEGLEHGNLGAFHSLEPDGQSRFMVANLTEPGSFDPEAMTEQTMPGVSLFMVLPGPSDPPRTLDGMLAFARRLAARLNGEVLDERGNALTAQEAAYLREKVVEYWRRVRIGGGAV